VSKENLKVNKQILAAFYLDIAFATKKLVKKAALYAPIYLSQIAKHGELWP
jgi:hypothetical protein